MCLCCMLFIDVHYLCAQAVAKYGEGMTGEVVKRTPAEQRMFLEERFKKADEHKRKQLAAQEE